MINRGTALLFLFQLLTVAFLLVVFVGLARSLELGDGGLTDLPFAPSPAVNATQVHASATELEDLSCFECHSLAYFRKGEEFSHELHAEEDLVHCHLCHAFHGHLQVTTRDEVCEKCH